MINVDDMGDLPILADPSDDDILEQNFQFFEATKSCKLMALRWSPEEICQRFNLKPFYTFFLDFNPSWNAPYHNRYHSICMLVNCYEGMWHELSRVQATEARGLLVAALMHDFDHTQGHQPDEVNIERALKGLETAQRYATAKQLPLTSEELAVAIDCIKITKYPYEKDPVTIPEQIIRDADLMQPYEIDDKILERQFLGLKVEVNLQKKLNMTNQEFAVGIKDFYDKIVWHTEWAKKKAALLDWSSVKERLKDTLMRA